MSRVKLTDRDVKIIEFLKNNKCADTTTLSNIYFNGSLRSCQHRLKKLCDNGDLKSFRENILSQNIYYVKKKPSSYKHALKVTQFIAELHKLGIEVLKVKTPYAIGNMIADSLLVVRINGDVKILWLEVELTKFFNLNKYEDLYYSRKWKEVLPNFGSIVVVSDKKVKTNNKFDIIKIDTEFKNIDELLKHLL